MLGTPSAERRTTALPKAFSACIKASVQPRVSPSGLTWAARTTRSVLQSALATARAALLMNRYCYLLSLLSTHRVFRPHGVSDRSLRNGAVPRSADPARCRGRGGIQAPGRPADGHDEQTRRGAARQPR